MFKGTRLIGSVAALWLFAAAATQGLTEWAGQPPQKPPVFRGNTQVVSVDVIVRDGSGAVVRGLTAADFEVTEDGKPQAVSSFAFEEISDKPAGAVSVDLLSDAEARLGAPAAAAPSAPAAG